MGVVPGDATQSFHGLRKFTGACFKTVLALPRQRDGQPNVQSFRILSAGTLERCVVIVRNHLTLETVQL